MPGIGAIDILNHFYTPASKARRDAVAHEELVCRMETALGGFPAHSPQKWLELMDEAGVDKTFFAQTSAFSYFQRRLYGQTTVDEIYGAIKLAPDRFVGIASYNPFRIKDSLHEIDRAVQDYGFKGVFVHIYGFDIPLDDRKMYPLYAKCQDLGVPVIMQVGYVLEAMPSEHGRPLYLDRIALDFPELKLVGAHTGYPWCEELISICYKYDNVYLGADAHMPRYWDPSVVRFINSRGADKCLWGTNGLDFKRMLTQIDALELKEENKRKLLRDNAIRVFKL